ncbi:hypothetical protein V6N13_091030 [Hibiscus sabdariffa]|uniref:Uncharacterized protein n=1 Tax=Hibiscus sabdariffa TaxID=183260 RepID=A0ABR2R2Z6_9ROSI
MLSLGARDFAPSLKADLSLRPSFKSLFHLQNFQVPQKSCSDMVPVECLSSSKGYRRSYFGFVMVEGNRRQRVVVGRDFGFHDQWPDERGLRLYEDLCEVGLLGVPDFLSILGLSKGIAEEWRQFSRFEISMKSGMSFGWTHEISLCKENDMGRSLSCLFAICLNFITDIGLLPLLFQWLVYVLFWSVYYWNGHKVSVLRFYQCHDYLHVLHKIDKDHTFDLELRCFSVIEVEDERRALKSFTKVSNYPCFLLTIGPYWFREPEVQGCKAAFQYHYIGHYGNGEILRSPMLGLMVSFISFFAHVRDVKFESFKTRSRPMVQEKILCFNNSRPQDVENVGIMEFETDPYGMRVDIIPSLRIVGEAVNVQEGPSTPTPLLDHVEIVKADDPKQDHLQPE